MSQVRAVVMLTLGIVITGCGVTSRPRQTWVESTASPPTAFGERTREVMCMRALLVPFENTPKSFAVHRFEDHTGKSLTTGEIPQSLRVAAQSAIIQLGPAVRSINLDPSVIEAIMLTGHQGGFEIPDYIVQGAITGFDSDVQGEQSRRGFDALGGRGGGEFDIRLTRTSAWSFSNLTIGMTLSTTRNVSIPGGTATMQARLRRSQQDREAAFGVAVVGGGSATRERFVEGGHASAHHMLQLATIKLVGEAFNVPYWTCSSELTALAPPPTSVPPRVFSNIDVAEYPGTRRNYDSTSSGTEVIEAVDVDALYCGAECGEVQRQPLNRRDTAPGGRRSSIGSSPGGSRYVDDSRRGVARRRLSREALWPLL